MLNSLFVFLSNWSLPPPSSDSTCLQRPNWLPDSFRDPHTGALAVYFEPAAVIVTLVLLGQVLELRARSQTSSAIESRLGLAPKTARVVLEDGSEEDVPLDQVQVGTRLRVRPAERIPTDGISAERNEDG